MAIDDPSMAEEGYIDMEFKSSSLIEFRFQMNSNLDETSLHRASPADELIYKGKLLPLRPVHDRIEEKKATRTPRASAATTPYMSCNASPAAACFGGGEIGLEDFFHHCPEELIRPQSKRSSWSQTLKSIKEAATLASKAYLKSLFRTPWLSKVKEGSKKKGKVTEEQKHKHRRSFSSSSIRRSPTKSSSSPSRNCSESSSFSSVNSAELSGQSVLKRSSSVNSDAERSIKGAIAHCKKSQQKDSSKKSSSDVGFCLLNVAKIAPDCEHEKL